MPKKKVKKLDNKAFPHCALRHWDCIQCDENCRCHLLTDMEVVEKRKHCGFYKKRGQL